MDTTRYLLEWPKSATLTTTNADKDAEQQELSHIAGGDAKWYSHIGRQFGSFLQNISLPYDIAITLLGIYRKELKTYALIKSTNGCL